jgi:integrase
MAKRVRDATMDSKAARERLRVRGKPYYRQIERGLHLGYRRLKGKAGTWVARHYAGEQSYQVESLGTADDFSDADGIKVLTYYQAVEAARARMAARTKVAEGVTATAVTVRDAVQTYIASRDARDSRRKGFPARSDAAQRLGRYVVGQPAKGHPAAPLAALALHLLDDADLRKWREGLPRSLKATTVRRTTSDLKAALNAAYASHRKNLPATLPAIVRYGLKVEASDDADPVARDNQILNDADVTKLLRAAQEVDTEEGWNGDLYRMVLVLAATGARFSQVARLRVGDFQDDRIMMPVSRKGTGKSGSIPVPVGGDVTAALRPVVRGRGAAEWLLERHRMGGRGPWTAHSLTVPWQIIRARAKMPTVVAYALRHSSIVRGLRANLPIRLVAALHDTSVKMIEAHYGKFIVDGLEDLARAAVVTLAPQAKVGKVLTMRGR